MTLRTMEQVRFLEEESRAANRHGGCAEISAAILLSMVADFPLRPKVTYSDGTTSQAFSNVELR